LKEQLSFWQSASKRPERVALIEPDGSERKAGELLASANQIVHGLRARGLSQGDCIALSMTNCGLVLELYLAAMQAGWQITPINTHLTEDEVAYVLRDSRASAFFGDDQIADKSAEAAEAAGLGPGQLFSRGEIPGFEPIEALQAGQPTRLPDHRMAGQMLQYTSGTTGRPKGVRRALPPMDPDTSIDLQVQLLLRFGIEPGGDGVHLCGSPMYHLAALAYSWFSLHFDHCIVVMSRWKPEAALEVIERYRVTQTQMVPTQFHRLLQLPEKVRSRYDTSSLRNVLHAAAPCPVELKRRMLGWWRPVIYEYYGSSEGGGTLVGPEDWLAHPGTVGRAWEGAEVRILDDDGKQLPPGEMGGVYLKVTGDFEYGGDAEKTRAGRRGDFFTAGDIGYLDDEGYLFLCDRKIDMIISGGVNVYPAEVEGALLEHRAVGDAAVIGIPHEDWGEEVLAIIEPAAGVAPDAALGNELIAFCRERIAGYKCPRSVRFIEALPRDPNGKLYKRRLREPYWEGRERRI
jgi:long-chain acyl-CoA synthetase